MLAVVILAVSVTACRKSPLDTTVRWHRDLESSLASVQAEHKPLVVFFGATWDTAWKEIREVTLIDPEVRALLHRDFISMFVDSSDDENPTTRELSRRFNVIGDPSIIILGPDGATEISRFNEFIPPDVMVRALRAATKKDAVREAQG